MDDTLTINPAEDKPFDELPEEVRSAPISPQVGLAALALNYALKYADINTVHDGQLYQQFKLEGRNMTGLHLDEVFHYAAQIEKHLMESPSRLALMVLNAVAEDIDAAVTDVAPAESEDEA